MIRLRALGLLTASVAGWATTVAVPGAAVAQSDGVGAEIEIPAEITELRSGDDGAAAENSDIDLANVVQSAAKGVTTVQEAPAIVTVLTSEEIARRHYRYVEQAFGAVPGWSRGGLLHSNFQTPIVRGQIQAVQVLHDSMSLFDPYVNIPTTSRVQPIETIKRIEAITGPGGVLWGSNSLLGILNIITKDADDVDGVEMGGTLGGGDGDRGVARAYAMIGESDVGGTGVSVFAHGSFETYKGAAFEMPLLLFHQPLPQPNAPNTYGPMTTASPPRSMIVNLSGKLTFKNLQLRFQVPFAEKHNPLGLSGVPIVEELPQDSQLDANGNLLCPNDPEAPANAACVDQYRTARDLRADFLDRYAVLEYRTRFKNGQAGLGIRAYVNQFVREFRQLAVLAPSPLIQGGLAFGSSLSSYRAGTAVEGDVQFGKQVRVLYGAEAFHEWKPITTSRSLQGEGTESFFHGPNDLSRLPLLCPRELVDGAVQFIEGCPLTFAFPASRSVLGAYVNPQYRPTKKLILDAGARVQVAPAALGKLSYAPTVTAAATAVYNFIPNWHAKLNFAQGFRPPVFNNTNSNGEAVQIGGNPDLEVETSNALQAEVNARLFKGKRRIRELDFRFDYSYTQLQNLIQVAAGRYENSADRGIQSAEFLSRLYIQGGHGIEFGYTWLRVDTEDKGRVRTLPEHWLHLGAVFNVIDEKLTASANLQVTGAMEDPNRIVETRGLTYDEMGTPDDVSVNAAELVMDRLPASAELSLGLTWLPLPKLSVSASVLNALSGQYYQADAFGDYEPHLEFVPNPSELLRAYVSATYHY